MGLAILIVAAGIVWYVQFGSLFGLSPRSSVSGTIVLYLPTPWTTPDGETLSGLISYTSGTVSQRIPPEIMKDKVPFSISPSGKHVLLMSIPVPSTGEPFDGMDGLLIISTDNPADQKLLLSVEELEGRSVVSAAWAPDDTLVAVGIVSGTDASPTAETTIFNLEDGRAIPTGSGVPVIFSPTQVRLLVADDGVFTFRTPEGESYPISGMVVGTQPEAAAVSADGSYFSLYFSDGSQGAMHLYRTEWERSAVTELGVLGPAATQGYAFGPEGDLLVFDGQTFELMKDTGSSFAPKKSMNLPAFPEHTVLIGWYGFTN